MQRLVYVLASSWPFLSEGVQMQQPSGVLLQEIAIDVALAKREEAPGDAKVANVSQNLTFPAAAACGGAFEDPCYWLNNSWEDCPGVKTTGTLTPGWKKVEAGGPAVETEMHGTTTEKITRGNAVAHVSGVVNKCPSVVDVFLGCTVNIEPSVMKDPCEPQTIKLTLGLLTALSTVEWPGIHCPNPPGELKFKGPLRLTVDPVSASDESIMENSPIELNIAVKNRFDHKEFLCIRSTNSFLPS